MMETQTHESTVSVSATRGIDVGKIEKELAAMWEQASRSEGADDAGVVRACALNLIVYTTAQEDRAQIDEMLEAVGQQHPGRALVLVADREASAPSLEAYVSSRCRVLGASHRQVCGEQVTIEAGGPIVETAASAIAPLLVPDVPVFLWWKDIPHYDDKLFDRMARMSDRVVIDSAGFDHPHEDMLRLGALVRSFTDKTARISDLNWGRLTSWRMLLASFWDVSSYRPHLDRVDRVTIEYDPPDAAPNEIAPKALLAAGWLASRLGWKADAGGASRNDKTVRFTFSAGERPLVIEMRAMEDGEGAAGMLASLVLSEATTGAEFSVALSRDGNRLETSASIDGEHTVGRVLAYEQKTEGQRLSREMGLLARDRIYEQALDVAAQLIEALQ
jgi:glucose-6-phosphate dehydrogenase assembly protein OpcA